MVPIVALVGRPNVGKSTLFNRLVGKRAALVDDRPGVTRDRLFGEMHHAGKVVRVVDTGGYDPSNEGDFTAMIRDQAHLAIDEADLVIFVLDGQAGLVPIDSEIASILRKSGKPTLAVANKLDVVEHDGRLSDLFGLGFEPIGLSAEHGRGVGDLAELLVEMLDPPDVNLVSQQPLPVAAEEPTPGHATSVEWQGGPIRVAVIGRPNAGKSSLVNQLLGEKRVLESEIPGTTRDAIDAELEYEGQEFVLVDTAGLRRKRSIADRLEHFAVMSAVRGLDSADVALVVMDASVPVSEQDAKVVALAHERGKGVILVANKWDLIPGEEAGREYVELARIRLPFVDYAPLRRTSARTGHGVQRLLGLVVQAQRERHRRVSTSELNRFFKEVVDIHPPPVSRGKRPRLFYVSQPLVRPPTFICAASHADEIPPSYRRYLINTIRERYGYSATPIWVKFRGRK
ncbi:MAG: ribosome biogenesis GTPase Der [Deltaproteobacteria bacterium RIFOXYA12_FULL_58_15]|nr:MAG: ribosome biogenesis GTPase Der [Deltaproteobacteria bacterium RIFOXYA12_FULL_58_15]OGR14119.1 MAG: ribosome biogenesis GTPase Der [Deltaproteobacteria bacterium RIFOXYB12_FULL_58_9]